MPKHLKVNAKCAYPISNTFTEFSTHSYSSFSDMLDSFFAPKLELTANSTLLNTTENEPFLEEDVAEADLTIIKKKSKNRHPNKRKKRVETSFVDEKRLMNRVDLNKSKQIQWLRARKTNNNSEDEICDYIKEWRSFFSELYMLTLNQSVAEIVKDGLINSNIESSSIDSSWKGVFIIDLSIVMPVSKEKARLISETLQKEQPNLTNASNTMIDEANINEVQHTVATVIESSANIIQNPTNASNTMTDEANINELQHTVETVNESSANIIQTGIDETRETKDTVLIKKTPLNSERPPKDSSVQEKIPLEQEQVINFTPSKNNLPFNTILTVKNSLIFDYYLN
jgi:hypothetical protein